MLGRSDPSLTAAVPGGSRPSGVVDAKKGFDLVEDDDVVFTLGVCREVNRIYQDYQEGRLQAGDELMSGMYVTLDVLAKLSVQVTKGMPAMRVVVATAQAKEIVAVVYGQQAVVSLDPVSHGRLSRRHRSVVAAAVHEDKPASRLQLNAPGPPAVGPFDRRASDSVVAPTHASPPPVSSQPAVAAASVVTPPLAASGPPPVAAQPVIPVRPVVEATIPAQPIIVSSAPAQPVAEPQPVEAAQPVVQPQPVAAAQPVAQPQPVAAQPVAEPQPVEAAQPVVQPQPVAAAQPVAQPQPVVSAQPLASPVRPSPAPVVGPTVVVQASVPIQPTAPSGPRISEPALATLSTQAGGPSVPLLSSATPLPAPVQPMPQAAPLQPMTQAQPVQAGPAQPPAAAPVQPTAQAQPPAAAPVQPMAQAQPVQAGPTQPMVQADLVPPILPSRPPAVQDESPAPRRGRFRELVRSMRSGRDGE